MTAFVTEYRNKRGLLLLTVARRFKFINKREKIRIYCNSLKIAKIEDISRCPVTQKIGIPQRNGDKSSFVIVLHRFIPVNIRVEIFQLSEAQLVYAEKQPENIAVFKESVLENKMLVRILPLRIPSAVFVFQMIFFNQ